MLRLTVNARSVWKEAKESLQSFSQTLRVLPLLLKLWVQILSTCSIYITTVPYGESSNTMDLVGSIIGDALLAVFGVTEAAAEIERQENKYLNKSEQAIMTAYELHEVKKILHEEMRAKHDELLLEKRPTFSR